jgi:ABC-2 type transport system permease protein
MNRTLLPALSLARREFVRFLRQRNRVVSALLQPALFLVLFGAGFRGSFRMDAVPGGAAPGDFTSFLFVGTVVLVVLFTAIFSSFSIIEDRDAGFLQSVLAAPVTRSGIVLGKVFGGGSIALVQGLLFLCLAPLAGVALTAAGFAAAAGALALTAFGLSALGVAFAWPMRSTAGFHAVMMLVLMPMWLLSGAFFPLAGAPGWLGWTMRLNPMTYGVALVRHAVGDGAAASAGTPGPGLALAVTAGFAVLTFAAALGMVSRRSESS